MTDVRVREGAHDDLRCPYCRDPVEAADRAQCPGCDVVLHLDCLGELTRCTSIGCPQKPRDFLAGAERRPLLVEPPPSGGTWKVGARRALLVGSVIALPMVTIAAIEGGGVDDVLINLFVGLLVGAITLPATWFEAWDARRAPSTRRHVLAAAANGVVGALGGFGCWLLAFTLESLRWASSVGEAMGEAWRGVTRQVLERPMPGAYLVSLVAASMACVGFARLRGWSLRRQTLFSLGTVGALAVALWLGRDRSDSFASDGERVYVVIAAVITLLFPAASWLVEAVRWRAWNPLRAKAQKKPE